MARPERFQLPFDFGRRPDLSQIYYEPGLLGHELADNSNRFVRRFREEVHIRSPYGAALHLMTHVFTPFDTLDQEEMWCLLLDTKNRITHEALVYRGTVNTIYIRQAELFKEAVRVNSPAIILSHVHPSGDPRPSPEDILVTRESVLASKILGIDLLDHIIVGRENYISLKEKQVGFESQPALGPGAFGR